MLRLAIEKKLPGFHLQVALEAREPVLVLFGPSGSGKSVTLQCIAGLMRPDAGTIEVCRHVVFDARAGVNLPARQRRVGYVFQNHALFPHLTVGQNIGYGLHRLPREKRGARVQEALRTVRLEGMERRRPGELSGGQQQRVALARALVTSPELLLLDEPFASLDTRLREELRTELLALLQETQVPAVLVTHDLDEAYALGRGIAVYDAGRVLQHGPRDAVYHRPASRRAAELVGVKNILPGIVQAVSGCYTEIKGPGFTLWGPAATASVGERVACCVRPEDVLILDNPPALEDAQPGRTVLTCTLAGEVAYGSHVALALRPAAAGERDAVPALHATLPVSAYMRFAATCPANWIVALDAARVHVIASGH